MRIMSISDSYAAPISVSDKNTPKLACVELNDSSTFYAAPYQEKKFKPRKFVLRRKSNVPAKLANKTLDLPTIDASSPKQRQTLQSGYLNRLREK